MKLTITKENWENKKEERRTNVWEREGFLERAKKTTREKEGSWGGGKRLEKQKREREKTREEKAKHEKEQK